MPPLKMAMSTFPRRLSTTERSEFWLLFTASKACWIFNMSSSDTTFGARAEPIVQLEEEFPDGMKLSSSFSTRIHAWSVNEMTISCFSASSSTLRLVSACSPLRDSCASPRSAAPCSTSSGRPGPDKKTTLFYYTVRAWLGVRFK